MRKQTTVHLSSFFLDSPVPVCVDKWSSPEHMKFMTENKNLPAVLAAAFLCFGSTLFAGETKLLSAPSEPILCGVRTDPSQRIKEGGQDGNQSAEIESIHLLIAALETERKQDLLDLLNRGSTSELTKIKGIAAGRAKIIVSSRPFRSLDELLLLRGFGFSLTASVIQHEIRAKNT